MPSCPRSSQTTSRVENPSNIYPSLYTFLSNLNGGFIQVCTFSIYLLNVPITVTKQRIADSLLKMCLPDYESMNAEAKRVERATFAERIKVGRLFFFTQSLKNFCLFWNFFSFFFLKVCLFQKTLVRELAGPEDGRGLHAGHQRVARHCDRGPKTRSKKRSTRIEINLFERTWQAFYFKFIVMYQFLLFFCFFFL